MFNTGTTTAARPGAGAPDRSLNVDMYDDPFSLPSGTYKPKSLADIFDWCLFLYLRNPEYRRAASRIVRIFIEEFALSDLGKEEKTPMLHYLKYELKLPTALMRLGDDYACYGNAFARIAFPFKRMLVPYTVNGNTPKKNERTPLTITSLEPSRLRYDPNTVRYVYKTLDGKEIVYDFVDVKLKSKDGIKIVFYDPRDIDIYHCSVTDSYNYVYRIPSKLQNHVTAGSLFHINSMPKSMLVAIKNKLNYQFTEAQLFHFRAPTVTGVSDDGWGFPDILANFALLYQIQVYRKLDQVVGQEYMTPLRYFALDDSPGGGASSLVDGSEFSRIMEQVIATRRRDKTAMFALPFRAKYDEVGGRGRDLAPKDLLEYQVNNMLNAMGFPAELHTMSLSVQHMPAALRILEKDFWFVHENFNRFCTWSMDQINAYIGNQNVKVTLLPPTMANDLEQTNLMMGLALQGDLPRAAVYKKLGYPSVEEAFRERAEEDMALVETQEEVQQEAIRRAEAEASLHAVLQEGDEPPPGSQVTDGQDLHERAMEVASEWGAIESDGERSKAMEAMKVQNYELYAIASKILQEKRNAGASKGRAEANAQMREGG